MALFENLTARLSRTVDTLRGRGRITEENVGESLREVRMRVKIDEHDIDFKARTARKLLAEGDKVKVTLRFRGREMAHQELGAQLLDRVKQDTSTIAKVESEPRLEGRQMVMVLAPR